MKNLLILFIICAGFYSCNPTNNVSSTTTTNETNLVENDTLRIVNEEVEYEIIIIEPGFNAWLAGRAKPRGFYNQRYLENRNILFVTEYNNRANQTFAYDPNLYLMRIDYNPNIDYGYEVNYLLYYYFIYFQINYNQQLTSFVPRI